MAKVHVGCCPIILKFYIAYTGCSIKEISYEIGVTTRKLSNVIKRIEDYIDEDQYKRLNSVCIKYSKDMESILKFVGNYWKDE